MISNEANNYNIQYNNPNENQMNNVYSRENIMQGKMN